MLFKYQYIIILLPVHQTFWTIQEFLKSLFRISLIQMSSNRRKIKFVSKLQLQVTNVNLILMCFSSNLQHFSFSNFHSLGTSPCFDVTSPLLHLNKIVLHGTQGTQFSPALRVGPNGTPSGAFMTVDDESERNAYREIRFRAKGVTWFFDSIAFWVPPDKNRLPGTETTCHDRLSCDVSVIRGRVWLGGKHFVNNILPHIRGSRCRLERLWPRFERIVRIGCQFDVVSCPTRWKCLSTLSIWSWSKSKNVAFCASGLVCF